MEYAEAAEQGITARQQERSAYEYSTDYPR